MTFDTAAAYPLHERVALRPEPFGALAYHYGNRRLNFLRAPELVALVEAYCAIADISQASALQSFGTWLFPRLLQAHPYIPGRRSDAFGLLEDLHDLVHVEVRKLYPDAELPVFDVTMEGDNRMVVLYESSRPLADLAQGLLIGCCDHFSETITVTRTPREHEDGLKARFILDRQPETSSSGS